MLLQPARTKCTKSTNLYRREIVEKEILKFQKRLNNLLTNLSDGSMVLNYGSIALRACPADFLRVLSELKVNNNLELTVRNIFINCIFSCEKQATGSGIICASILKNDSTVTDYESGFFRTRFLRVSKPGVRFPARFDAGKLSGPFFSQRCLGLFDTCVTKG